MHFEKHEIKERQTKMLLNIIKGRGSFQRHALNYLNSAFGDKEKKTTKVNQLLVTHSDEKRTNFFFLVRVFSILQSYSLY